MANKQMKKLLEGFKYEIASELGIRPGADTSARLNGKIGGEMTKRMVAFAKAELDK